MTSKRTSKRRTSKRTSRRPAPLTPNAPIDRLGFIRKTYGEKQPWVVLDTLSVIFNTIGIDEPWPALQDEIHRQGKRWGPLNVRGYVMDLFGGLNLVHGVPGPHWLENLPDWTYAEVVRVAWSPTDETALGPPFWRRPGFSLVLELIDSPTFADGAMREPHEADSIFPWVARELSKVAKPVIADEGRYRYPGYEGALDALRDRTNAIAQWAKAKRVDLMKMSLGEVLEAGKDFRHSGKVRQGKVVYKFSTGWTVQELRGRRELDPEGKALLHCAGTYCERVERGESVIYSLRDPDGVPYVTMEWQPQINAFKQIFGKTNSPIGSKVFSEHVFQAGQDNEPPLTREELSETVELIRAMVVEFIDKVKNGNVPGLLLAGAHETIRTRDLLGADLTRANLAGVKLAGVKMRDAKLTWANMSGADLTDADLSGADLAGASMNNIKLLGANLNGADLTHAYMLGANLTYATMVRATLDKVSLIGANLRNADLTSANLTGATMINADLREADLRSAQLNYVDLNGAILIGAKYDDHTIWRPGFDPAARGAVKVW